jgi:AcrR family transcriptional regulator
MKEEVIRQNILSAAKRLFQHYGITKTTMDDIAKAVGKGKSSLYYYYATKDDIFEAVIKDETADIESKLEKAISEETNPELKLQAYVNTKYKELKKRRLRYSNIMSDFENNLTNSNRTCVFNVIRNRGVEFERTILKSIIIEGVELGIFNKEIQQDVNLYTEVCVNVLKGLDIDLLIGNYSKNIEPAALINVTISFLIKGLK